MSFDFTVLVPRDGDAYYLDVTNQAGRTTRFPIDALDDAAALYEVGYVLGMHGMAPESTAALHRVNGEVVASGNREWFEEASDQ